MSTIQFTTTNDARREHCVCGKKKAKREKHEGEILNAPLVCTSAQVSLFVCHSCTQKAEPKIK